MGEKYAQRPDITFSQDLSAAALSYTTTIGRSFRLQEITYTFDAATTETITITKVSAKGASYNSVLRKLSLVASTDFVFRPESPGEFQVGDEIKVACTNANGVNVASGTIKTKEVG